MTQRDTITHLVAGGVAGTVGAIFTCPLEVVKTRLQSSCSSFYIQVPNITATRHKPMNLVQCLRHIVKYEGPAALFKGLGPHLIGVAPARAIYFCTYSQSKQFFNSILPPDTPIVHVCSASIAGFVTSSATNPIWFVKTRLQLDCNKFGQTTSASNCIRRIYTQSGIRGFYKGITASYMGISETVVNFVIYEAVKAELIAQRYRTHGYSESKSSKDFLEFMMAGAISKTIASCIAYPHEVVRTRLREEGNKYKAFWQTLSLVFSEEGIRGVYRGLSTQLVRQIPNTAIMMATYEALVYMLTRHFTSEFYTASDRE